MTNSQSPGGDISAQGNAVRVRHLGIDVKASLLWDTGGDAPVLKIEGVTHWSISVKDLNEAEEFYGDLLGLTAKGRLGNNAMSRFNVRDHSILLCERSSPVDRTMAKNGGARHSFTASPDIFNERSAALEKIRCPSRFFYYHKSRKMDFQRANSPPPFPRTATNRRRERAFRSGVRRTPVPCKTDFKA